MQANRRHMETQTKIATEQEDKRKRRTEEGRKKRANFFENHFRSGGEEKERRIANNVMQGRRIYDGYLVCLDLT